MEGIGVRRGLDTFVFRFGEALTLLYPDSATPIRHRRSHGRIRRREDPFNEKGIFQILVYLIQVIYAVELSLFWRFICEIYNSLNSLLRPHSSVTCPSSSRDRPPYTYEGHEAVVRLLL